MGSPFMAACGIVESLEIGFKNIERDAQYTLDRYPKSSKCIFSLLPKKCREIHCSHGNRRHFSQDYRCHQGPIHSSRCRNKGALNHEQDRAKRCRNSKSLILIFQILLKYMVSPLLSTLQFLVKNCELIIFTVLPKGFVDKLLDKIPELRDLFSYVLAYEELQQTADLLVKDLTPLIKSRNVTDIIIIDVDDSRIDDEYFSSIILQQKYDGSINYSQVMLVNETLKQVIKNNNLLYGDKKPSKLIEKEGALGQALPTEKATAADKIPLITSTP